MNLKKRVYFTYILLKLRIKYRDLLNVLEQRAIIAKNLSNFGNHRQKLSDFDENLLKIGILSAGTMIFNHGIELLN
jgi:hypothetical protein